MAGVIDSTRNVIRNLMLLASATAKVWKVVYMMLSATATEKVWKAAYRMSASATEKVWKAAYRMLSPSVRENV